MVVIRLARTGSKKNPFYHVVVADKRNARDSGYIENVGYFNPMARGKAIRLELKKERIDQWLSKGAQASERVNHLIKEFSKQGVEPVVRPTKAEMRLTQADASREAAKKKLAAEKKAAAEEAKKAEADEAAATKAEAAAEAEPETEKSAEEAEKSAGKE